MLQITAKQPMASSSIILCASILVIAVGLYKLLAIGSRDKRLPPGPPTLPILGNLHLVPKTGLGLKYAQVQLQKFTLMLMLAQVERMGPAIWRRLLA